MYYNSSTGQNQSEKKGFVTSSFCPSRCNVTLEKIDQEMYFWSRLSIIPHIWPSKVASLQLFETGRIFRFFSPPQVVVGVFFPLTSSLTKGLCTFFFFFFLFSSFNNGIFIPSSGRWWEEPHFSSDNRKVVPCFARARGTPWNSINT